MPDTRTAQIRLSEGGVVIVRVKNGARQFLADAKENFAMAVRATAGRRRPLLIDLRTAPALDAEVRHHYSGQTFAEAFSALALLLEASPLGRMMGNVYLRVARPGIPAQLFSEEPQALEWLNGYHP